MFIQRLTKKQLERFLNKYYPTMNGWTWNFFICTRKDNVYYHVKLRNELLNFSRVLTLFDFDANGISPKKWRNYLYDVFDEEYKEEYINHCLKEFV